MKKILPIILLLGSSPVFGEFAISGSSGTGAGIIITAPTTSGGISEISLSTMTAGATNYIFNQSLIVQQASFTVLSGTVTGRFYVGSIQFPNGTVMVSSPPASGIGDMVLASTQSVSGAKSFNSYTNLNGSVTVNAIAGFNQGTFFTTSTWIGNGFNGALYVNDAGELVSTVSGSIFSGIRAIKLSGTYGDTYVMDITDTSNYPLGNVGFTMNIKDQLGNTHTNTMGTRSSGAVIYDNFGNLTMETNVSQSFNNLKYAMGAGDVGSLVFDAATIDGTINYDGVNSSFTTSNKFIFLSTMSLSGGYQVQNVVPLTNQVLTFNGTIWAPATPSAGSGDAVLAATQTWSGRNIYTSTQGIKMTPNAGTGSTAGTSGALLIDGTLASNGIIAQIYRNDPNTQASASALLALINDATSYNTNMMWIINRATSTLGGSVELNIHANNPDIEFRELDKYSAGSGVGQYEIAVNNDELQLNYRNTGDTAFQQMIGFNRDGKMKFKEGDDGGDFISFEATTTMTGSNSFVWPNDTPVVGEGLRIASQVGSKWNLDWSFPSLFTYTWNASVANIVNSSAPFISNSTGAASASVYFDEVSTQAVTYSGILNNYNGNALSLDIVFLSTATSGTVNWGAYIECKTPNVDALSYNTDSFSTINSTSVTVGATASMAMKATVALTNGDSCANGDTVRIKLERQAGLLDTAVGFAQQLFIRLFE